MKRKPSASVVASVRDRLLNLSRARGEEFNFILIRYGLERLLYRLTVSAHSDAFVLKGAMLYAAWSKHPHRATKDLDLLGTGAPELDRLREIFETVCAIEYEPDGMVFEGSTVRAVRIKEEEEYEGVRVTLDAKLGSAKLMLQIDVGFGDAVTPEPLSIEYPSLLSLPLPRLRAYPRETVVAEKLQAMVHLGLANSRMKDFFDVWFLCGEFAFDGAVLRAAIGATFERRKTDIPAEPPLALTAAFADDEQKQTQWKAFLNRSRVGDKTLTLSEVVRVISAFLMPPLDVLRRGAEADVVWPPGGPWRPRL